MITYLSYSFSLSLPLDILTYVSAALLIAIFFLALRINSKLSQLTGKSIRSSHSSESTTTEPEASEEPIQAPPGTPFEKFLEEDPQRRLLGKKEQFASYRRWRAEKGLNWNNKDDSN